MCRNGDESVIHLFIKCDFAINVWRRSGLMGTLRFIENGNFWENYVAAIHQLMKEQIPLFVMICWHIWSARNKVVWERKIKTSEEVIFVARKMLIESQTVRSMFQPRQSHKQIIHSKKWRPPQLGQYKMNVDGAVFDSLRTTSLGAVIRDAHGEILAVVSSKINGLRTPFMAELLALVHSLKVLKNFLYSKL